MLKLMVLGASFQRLVEGLSLVQQISVSFSCPFHCGANLVPWFVCGFSVGLLTGILLCLALIFYLYLPYQSITLRAPASSPSPATSVSRLRGYLHERQPQ